MDNYQKFGAFSLLISIPFAVTSFFNNGASVIFISGVISGLIYLFHAKIEERFIRKMKKPLIAYASLVFASGIIIEILAYLTNLAKISSGLNVYLFSQNFFIDVFVIGVPHYLMIALLLSLMIRKYHFSSLELGFMIWLIFAVFVDDFSHFRALLAGNIIDFTMAGLLMVFALHWPIVLFQGRFNEIYSHRSNKWVKFLVLFFGFLLVFILTLAYHKIIIQ